MKKIMTLLLAASFSIIVANAQTLAELHKKQYNLDDNGLAIKGYDPVCYFTANKAVKGSESIALTTEGATYHFATTQDRDLFKANPEKYAPQYGGWCAYAMGANGDKVNIDPGTFELLNGKLYLFYNQYFNNTRKTWDKDVKNLKAQADIHWAKYVPASSIPATDK
jgi:YHS domain-containing protein